jgi:EpsI family protein
MKSTHNHANVRTAAIAGFLVLLGGGVAHRWLDRLLIAADAMPVALRAPLSALPLEFSGWRGSDVPLDKRVIEIAGSDDHIHRRYVEEGTRNTVELYVTFVARPAKMLSHRPEVCYTAQGWTHAGARKGRVALADGMGLDYLVHRFARSRPTPDAVVVLNYYVLGGRHVVEWTDFWGPKWRLPNLSRDPSFYVAQVQISSSIGDPSSAEQVESVLERFAAEVAPKVDGLLPLVEDAEES